MGDVCQRMPCGADEVVAGTRTVHKAAGEGHSGCGYASGVKTATRATRGEYRYSGQRMKHRTNRRVERAAPIARKATQRHARLRPGMMQRDLTGVPSAHHPGIAARRATLVPTLK